MNIYPCPPINVLVTARAGKCPAAPAALLPGNIYKNCSQEIFLLSQEIFQFLARNTFLFRSLTKVNQFMEQLS